MAVKGFMDIYRNVFTVSSDTKIVSKILEMHLFPRLLAFVEQNDYSIVLAEKQNWYPDLSFVHKSDPNLKFAVDLKTSYRDPDFAGHVNGFTLGSHGAYFKDRTSTKNIQFPYSSYAAHICLGVIYTRVGADELDETRSFAVKELGGVNRTQNANGPEITVDDLRSITSVVRDFEFFVCEKWQLASDRQCSGNTANIGAITWIEDILPSSIFTPIRLVLAVLLLLPLAYGYNTGQYIVLFAAKYGSALATNAWLLFNSKTGDNPMGMDPEQLVGKPKVGDIDSVLNFLYLRKLAARAMKWASKTP